MKHSKPAAALLSLALVAAACSSGDDTAEVEEESTTTTEAAVTTTTAEEDEETPTSASAPAGDAAPLTGLSLPDGDDLDHPALAVKMDNHPNARPQTALDQADIVFEYRHEGVTRFLAVFHSQLPSPVGPVRSSRTSDFDLLRGLDTPLYSSSGGNDSVAASLRSLPIHDVTAISQSVYFRDGTRPAPHNLFVNAEDLVELAPADAPTPDPWFSYQDADAEPNPTATDVDGAVTIRYQGSPVVTYTWSSEAEGWLRAQDNRPHTTVTGDQLAPTNVVIMVTTYGTSAADAASPEVVSVGEGQVFVLTDGKVIEGTWTRATASDKPELLDADGDIIELMPGGSWVLFPESGQVTVS